MNGLTRILVLILGGTAAAAPAYAQPCATCATAAGCGACQDKTSCYDRCWPERYTNLAQRGVNRAFAPQVLNGHVLDQTVWNHHFEAGSDRLTRGGIAQLQYLSRRRPEPDRTVYLATANDLSYDPACPERYTGAKQELDTLRAAAIQKFMVSSNGGRVPDFQVLIHDPADVTLHTQGVNISVQQMNLRFRGGLANQAGGAGGAGASGGAAGGTGAGR